MIRFIRRLFASAPPPETNTASLSGGQRSRGIKIENREPPEGVIKVHTVATISAIFRGDVARQEAEFSRSATGGAISFNPPRRK
jgi:hypothetical protein